MKAGKHMKLWCSPRFHDNGKYAAIHALHGMMACWSEYIARTELAQQKFANMCAQYSGRKKSENEIVVHFRLKVDFIGAKRNYSGLIEYIIYLSRPSKTKSLSRRATQRSR